MTAETDNDVTVTKASRANGWLAGGGVLGGFFAFLGASCCVLPILLVNLGVSSAPADRPPDRPPPPPGDGR